MSTEHELAPAFDPKLAHQYRQAGYWGTRTIAEEFSRSAREHHHRTAVEDLHGSISYAELDRVSDRIGAGLRSAGLEPGDRVLFQVTNRLESIIAWYACLKAGLVPVATLAQHREHEMDAIAVLSAARAYIVDPEPLRETDLVALAQGVIGRVGQPIMVLTAGPRPPGLDQDGGLDLLALGADLSDEEARAMVVQAQRARGPESIAALQLSGGTTGTPKLIPRRHHEYWYNARAYAEHLDWTPDTKVAHLIPIIHNAGIVCGVHASHAVGATLLLGSPNAYHSLPLLAGKEVDFALFGHGHFSAVGDPEFLDALPSLRAVLLSGTKVPDALFEELEGRGIWVGQLFGMGEGLFVLGSRDDPREARLRSVGRALSPHDEIRILKPGTDDPVAPGEVGELCCRGPYTIPGYYAAPERNEEAFTAEGFYRTGDLATWARFDGVDHLLIEGRIKDLINRGGEKINAEEVEAILLMNPDVVEAAIVAMPDTRLGERVCAFITTTKALDLADIQAWFEEKGVAKFKWPERIELLELLPRTRVGKLDKAALRRAAASLAPGE